MNIVILPGWMQTKGSWAKIVNILRSEFNLEAWTLPGFGKEPLPSKKWHVSQYADWVNEKRSEAKYKRVVLVGHSFGGRIASEIASTRPKWLKGLILYGAPCLYRPTLDIRRKVFLYKLLRPFLSIKTKEKWATMPMRNSDGKNMERIFFNVVTDDQTDKLPLIDVPTQLIWGENDSLVPVSVAREIEELIAESELEIIPKGSHSEHLEKPDSFLKILGKSLKKISDFDKYTSV